MVACEDSVVANTPKTTSDSEDSYVNSLLMVICDGLSTMIKKGIPFQYQYSVDFLNDQLLASYGRRFEDGSNDRFIKFQSSQAPDVTVSGYLVRIQKHSKCSDACFLLALIYIDRLALNKGLKLTVLNIHRLLITCIMVAAKFHDDLFYNNDFYAKLGGLSLTELNKLELELLKLLDFSLFVAVPVFDAYSNLANRSIRGSYQSLSPTSTTLAHPTSNLPSSILSSLYNIHTTSSTFSSPSTIHSTAFGEVTRTAELRSVDVGVIAPRARHMNYNPNLDLDRNLTANSTPPSANQSSNLFLHTQFTAQAISKQVAFPEETCSSTHLRPNIWSFDSNWETNDSFSRCASTSASSFDQQRLESPDYLIGSNYPTTAHSNQNNNNYPNNQFYSEQSSLCSTSQSSPSATLSVQMKMSYGPSPPPLLYFKPQRMNCFTPAANASRFKDCETAPTATGVTHQSHSTYHQQSAAGFTAQLSRPEVYGSRVNGDNWATAPDLRSSRVGQTGNTVFTQHCPGEPYSEMAHYSSVPSPNNIDFSHSNHRLSTGELKQSSFSPPYLQQQMHGEAGECFEFSQVYTVPEEPFVLTHEWSHICQPRSSNNSSNNAINAGAYSTTRNCYKEPAARQESYRYHSAGKQQMYLKPAMVTEADRFNHGSLAAHCGARCIKNNPIPRCHNANQMSKHEYGAVGDNRMQPQQQHYQQRPRQQPQFVQGSHFNSNLINNNNFLYGQPPHLPSMMAVPYY
mmetsp:Transcript_22711/g.31133  ORF Transcript_22711/g.31133 Transcript_22711/m.31133 type:complete len:740 (-) Transcript_22711:255-2474(-)